MTTTSAPLPPAPAPAPAPRRRRLWPWAVAMVLLPLVVLGGVAVSVLTLGREVATLRREVMRATGSEWQPRVQLSAGTLLLGGVRTVLHFVPEPKVAEVRRVLAAVRRVSVGVYERTAEAAAGPRGNFAAATTAMARRGWTPIVSVQDDDATVLVFVAEDALEAGEPLDLCVAVVDGRELVVVSVRADPEKLSELAASAGLPALRTALRTAALR